jgi:uncharacterized protein (DUF2267 family)
MLPTMATPSSRVVPLTADRCWLAQVGASHDGSVAELPPGSGRDPQSICQRLRTVRRRKCLVEPDAQQAARAAVACTRVLSKHITGGEFDDVLAQLPPEIRSILTGD